MFRTGHIFNNENGEDLVHLHQDGKTSETVVLIPFLHPSIRPLLMWLPVYLPSCRPVLSVLADSDEESSSAGSSDEEEVLLSEPQGQVGEKGSTPATEG